MFDKHIKNAKDYLKKYEAWIKKISTSERHDIDDAKNQRYRIVEKINTLFGKQQSSAINIQEAITFIESLVIKSSPPTQMKDRLQNQKKPILSDNSSSSTGMVLFPIQQKTNIFGIFEKIKEEDYLIPIHHELFQAFQYTKLYQSKEEIDSLFRLDSFESMNRKIEHLLNNQPEAAIVDFNRDVQLLPLDLFQTAGENPEIIKKNISNFSKLAFLKKHFPNDPLETLYDLMNSLENDTEKYATKIHTIEDEIYEQRKNEKIDSIKMVLQKENTAINNVYQFILAAGGQTLNYGPNGKIASEYYLDSSLKDKTEEELEELSPDLNNVYSEAQWKINKEGNIELDITLHYFSASMINQNRTLDEETYAFISENGILKKVDMADSKIKNNKKTFPDLLTSHTKYELISNEQGNAKINISSHEEIRHTPQIVHGNTFLNNQSQLQFKK